MFAIEQVINTFALLEKLEKEHPCFNQTQKQSIYRIAFHKEPFDEVEKIIMQAGAPNLTVKEKDQVLEHHLATLPKATENILQIENYIFQLQQMSYEKNKANQMLEDILKRSEIDYDLDAMIAEARERPVKNPVALAKVEKTM
jgi:hypothetical protein